jgi:ArsR family transcriptional regulator, arsenate/arsenite/antimonite-responsive transcriptional repressor
MRLDEYNSLSHIRGAAPRSSGLPNLLPEHPLTVATDATVHDLDAVFKGFADPTRLRILSLLAAGELCVCDIVEILELPQPTISRHLAYLRRTGLVEVTREAKFAHYRLAEPAHDVHQTLISCVRTCFTGIDSLEAERHQAVARVQARLAAPCT